jgi:hypothetical protein
MVSVRELAEAQAYERRRRVRAFVAADPAPLRGDGPSTWRCLACGVALALVTASAFSAVVLFRSG